MGALSIAACNRDTEVGVPDFNVKTESLVYKVGEEVVFDFTGKADQISFYSGEPLHDYAFLDGRISQTSGMPTSFKTNVTYNTQPDMLSVWTSTDYNGGGTFGDIKNATWTNDVSGKFKIAPENNPWGSANNYSSGTVDLIEAADPSKPLYVAFKYKNDPSKGVARNWYMYEFKLNAVTQFSTISVITAPKVFNLVYDDQFVSADQKTSQVYDNYIMFTTPTVLRSKVVEVWAISPPIYIETKELGPDRPISVKGYRTPMPQKYSYVFNDSGTYTCTFVAYNSSVYGQKEIVKQLEIKITE